MRVEFETNTSEPPSKGSSEGKEVPLYDWLRPDEVSELFKNAVSTGRLSEVERLSDALHNIKMPPAQDESPKNEEP